MNERTVTDVPREADGGPSVVDEQRKDVVFVSSEGYSQSHKGAKASDERRGESPDKAVVRRWRAGGVLDVSPTS